VERIRHRRGGTHKGPTHTEGAHTEGTRHTEGATHTRGATHTGDTQTLYNLFIRADRQLFEDDSDDEDDGLVRGEGGVSV